MHLSTSNAARELHLQSASSCPQESGRSGGSNYHLATGRGHVGDVFKRPISHGLWALARPDSATAISAAKNRSFGGENRKVYVGAAREMTRSSAVRDV